MVEMIDLAPTFISALGCPPKSHVIEDRDLAPLLHGTGGFSRQYAIGEHDYSSFERAPALGIAPEDVRTVMIHDGWLKYICCKGFAPMLFDLQFHPKKLIDLGISDATEHV